MRDFIVYLREIFIKSITNNISFFGIYLIIFLGVATILYQHYQEKIELRIKHTLHPIQEKQCGVFFDFHDELILHRFRGGILFDQYFIIRTHDSKNHYFHYYPNDLKRLNLDKKQLPIYANICVFYSPKDTQPHLYPIISKITIQP